MSDSRLKLLDRIADGAVGVNMGDAMGAYAAMLLASMESARRCTDVPEPTAFSVLRGQLRAFLAMVGWADVDVDVVCGRQQ